MSVLDRVHKSLQQDTRRTAETVSETTQSSSLVQADPPVIQRSRFLIQYALEHTKGQIPWMVQSIVEEVIEEMADLPPDKVQDLADYLAMTAKILTWAATGETGDMPEDFKQMLALEPAGT